MSKRIVFTVTNDTLSDQRMQRICHSLGKHGYEVVLVGRFQGQEVVQRQNFYTVFQLKCFLRNGFFFYLEYNIRLLFTLLYLDFDIACAIDLDTAMAVRCITLLKRKIMVFDSHEYFIYTPELQGRTFKQRLWKIIEKISIRNIALAYTVNKPLADILSARYGMPFQVIRNLPYRESISSPRQLLGNSPTILMYQGAMNVGRGIDLYIEAMASLPDHELWLVGQGDLDKQIHIMWSNSPAKERIKLYGRLTPSALKDLTARAHIGLNILSNNSESYFYSLANKFFDYMQAGVPSINMNFPVYQEYVKKYDHGYLLESYSCEALKELINEISRTPGEYALKSKNSIATAKKLNWESEEKSLTTMYDQLL